MGKSKAMVLTLKVPTPEREMRIGKDLLKFKVPMVICFSDEDFKKFIDGQKKFIEYYFDVEDYDGDRKIKEGESFELGSEEIGVKEENEKEVPDDELKEILEGGNPELLAAYIKNKGPESVPNETLKNVLKALEVKFDGRKSFENLEYIEMLEKFIKEEKGE